MKGVALGLELMLACTLAGCGLALPPVTLPAQVRLKIVARSPETYGVRLRIGEPHDYRVPADGRVTLDVPAYRAGCSVFLLGLARLPNRSDPYTAKTVDLLTGGKPARQLSLKMVSALPVDTDGYHLLTLPPMAEP
jgi:hypothetical protein